MNKISTKLRQKQKAIPKQILQSRFLEMSISDIEEELQNEIEKNPVLVEKDIEDFREKSQDPSQFDNQENYDFFFANLAEDIDVVGSLIQQIEESDMNSRDKEIAKQIIFNVDENGFLDIEPELIADHCKADLSEVENMINVVKNLNPSGVGCKDIQEYLLFQIDEKDYLARKIIMEHFHDFLQQDFLKIKSNLNCSDSEFDTALDIISSKNFSPIVSHSESDYVIPDLIIRLKDEKWIILVNDKNLTKFKIANDYLDEAMLQKFSDKEKKFINDHIDNAQNLLDAIVSVSYTHPTLPTKRIV